MVKKKLNIPKIKLQTEITNVVRDTRIWADNGQNFALRIQKGLEAFDKSLPDVGSVSDGICMLRDVSNGLVSPHKVTDVTKHCYKKLLPLVEAIYGKNHEVTY